MPLQSLSSGISTPAPTQNIAGLRQTELLNKHYHTNEQLIEVIAKNPNLAILTKYGPDLMQKYNNIVAESKSQTNSSQNSVIQAEPQSYQNSFKLGSKIEPEGEKKTGLSKQTTTPMQVSPKSRLMVVEDKTREPQKKAKKEITKKTTSQPVKEKPKKTTPQPVITPEPILTEQAALKELEETYFKSDEDEFSPELFTFTRNFPGWHLDEIFDFINKASPVEVVEVIKYCLHEKEEKIRIAKEKEEEEAREKEDINRPRIRTRYWKQNNDNRRLDQLPAAPIVGKKHQKNNFILRLKQILETEKIDEVKANQLLLSFNNDVKRALLEVNNNKDTYKSSLALEF